mgnify:FL=1|tara:strand:+ start:422 stop:760 length:339 start_codon:yes stop_codon:yes gene_type:complete
MRFKDVLEESLAARAMFELQFGRQRPISLPRSKRHSRHEPCLVAKQQAIWVAVAKGWCANCGKCKVAAQWTGGSDCGRTALLSPAYASLLAGLVARRQQLTKLLWPCRILYG